MTRQDTLERIKNHLSQANDVVLESILGLLENIQPNQADELDQLDSTNDLDAWDEQIAKDSESGKLDNLVEDVLASHRAGKTTKLSQALKRSIDS